MKIKHKILTLLVFAVLQTYVNAQFTSLYDFDGDNGIWPNASVISDGTYLYGTTRYGGINNYGTIYKIKTDGSDFQKLLDFDGNNGCHSAGELFYDGTWLYGTTTDLCLNGPGAVFKIKPDGSDFVRIREMSPIMKYPENALISDGVFLYGVITGGYVYNNEYRTGYIYKVEKDGTNYSTLHDFGVEGVDITLDRSPIGSLLLKDNFLYGMTNKSIYRINTDGTGFLVLFYFDGTNPYGSLISVGNYLYGATDKYIFKIMPDGSGYLPIFDFSSNYASLGNFVKGPLFYDGTFLYGTTSQAGANDKGTIFKVLLDGSGFTKLFDFEQSTGTNPNGNLISDGTYLYGTTQSGYGTIFKIHKNNINISTNLSEQKTAHFTFSPNPSSSTLTISIASNFTCEKLFIYSISGQKLVEQKINGTSETIDVSSFSKGIYFIEIGNYKQKFVVE